MHSRTLQRPAQVTVAAARVLRAQDDMIVLGFSVVTGGPFEYDRRIEKAWSAFHAHKGPRHLEVFVPWDTVGALVSPRLLGVVNRVLGLYLERRD